MYALLMLLVPVLGTFVPNLDRALSLTQAREWKEAAAALDQAYADDPSLFEINNLHYLRGRVAEAQGEWLRASDEFSRIGAGNPLRPLAAWHGALAAVRAGAIERAAQLVDELPSDFPADMKMRLAADAPPALALRVYNQLSTRGARLRRAMLLREPPVLWALIRENNSDDVALEAARYLTASASQPEQYKDLAGTFAAHRQFADAALYYTRVASDASNAAEARFQLARLQFLKGDFAGAIEAYRAVSRDFPSTQWQKDADYQVANAYWRMRQYRDAERAYLAYIDANRTSSDGAVRDLADVYRSLGENTKALALLDRALSGRLGASTRQVLLFTKGKTLYVLKRYSAALEVFRQMQRGRFDSVPGGTSLEEVRYLEALTLSKMGNAAMARTAWTRLAAKPGTYYGQRAAAHLAPRPGQQAASPPICNPTDSTLDGVFQRLAARSHTLRDSAAPGADPVSELLFMKLWDEASIWLERTRRPDPLLATDLAYASGRYHRAISEAARLPGTAAGSDRFLYPAGFREFICASSAAYSVDPLWLHAIIWQESKYNPLAHSAAAARGLMQFIPDTAGPIAAAVGMADFSLERLYSPEINIRLGAYYWSTLLREFNTPEHALAAYNGGPENVRRWADKSAGDPELFMADVGFAETKRYIQAVFEARAAYARLN